MHLGRSPPTSHRTQTGTKISPLNSNINPSCESKKTMRLMDIHRRCKKKLH